jgi:hypothetical protein
MILRSQCGCIFSSFRLYLSKTAHKSGLKLEYYHVLRMCSYITEYVNKYVVRC